MKKLCRRRLLHLVVAYARGADANSLARTFDDCVDPMKVKIPAALRYIMGVADAMPELRAPAAHVTSFCHKNTLQPYVTAGV